ncbi:asparagine synthase (glutamine-hydrolyzing) [uncultured Clostridium sp.]|uniref:asparagine synthase (glutamine-hydrolyzing) n=1 Tax=uncultured Clostridium sp. TaxID=59620 RepID=UPI0025D0CA69|nr:asparagine synthase (glutamine-hydrolyzing) [uncultured Clostridium sp.]
MCGIAGFINFTKNISKDTFILKDMVNALENRGPDSSGYYISQNVLLGHRRLIVVDPIGGKQPMIKKYNNNEYVLVYNGELYNTEDIRKELLFKGFTFDSYSDTEVILTSYIAWGFDCIKKFNGIFAFAIFDKNKNTIFLGRDPFGVKPLFYYIKDNTFIFASEIKSLLKHPYIEPILDKDSLTKLFALGPAVPLGSGILKNIQEIPPANCIILTKSSLKLYEYWKLTPKEITEDIPTIIEHTRNLLIDSIKRQLVGDVPLCTFLSGGLDSSAITAIAANEYKKKNKTLTSYSIDYEDNDKYFKASFYQPTSDQYWALKMAKFLNTNHITITLNHSDLVKALKDATLARDLPGMADVDSSLYLFCKEIKKDFVIALSGECADEIFGGYPWFTNPDLRWSNTFPWSRFINDRISILNNDLKNLKISEYANEEYLKTLKEVPHLDNESKEDFREKELSYLNLKWFMVTLLNRKDRMSMANSLEVRVPFADYRLVEYAFNLPSNIKLLDGREKGLLRKALEGILPDDIVYRKKSPYPKTHNPIYTELVCNIMSNILSDNTSPILSLIDKKKVTEIVNTKGSSYKTPWYGQLMTGPQLIAYLIQVNTWLKEYNIKIEL